MLPRHRVSFRVDGADLGALELAAERKLDVGGDAELRYRFELAVHPSAVAAWQADVDGEIWRAP